MDRAHTLVYTSLLLQEDIQEMTQQVEPQHRCVVWVDHLSQEGTCRCSQSGNPGEEEF